MGKTVLITGASSGIGLLTAITLDKRGWHVVATMRDLARREKLETPAQASDVLDRIEIHPLDVTSAEQIEELTKTLAQRGVPLHALVNNAGVAIVGFAEDVSDSELRRQFDTNFFGAAAVTRAFISQFKQQRFGHIVMISSISGLMGFPGVGSYAASKFALEGWSETLRMELKPHGISVVLIEPGAFDTDIWTRNALVSEQTRAVGADPNSADGARISRWLAKLQSRKTRPNPPLVADLMARGVENPRPRLRYSFGSDAWMGLLLRKLLPWSWFENMIVKSSGIAE